MKRAEPLSQERNARPAHSGAEGEERGAETGCMRVKGEGRKLR